MSTDSGHAILLDVVSQASGAPESLERLRRVPFVRRVDYLPGSILKLGTAGGTFRFVVEEKRSYLSRSAISQTLTWLNHLRSDHELEVILLARHIPRPAAERLIEAGVNFADDVGNIHLELGNRYNWTVIGIPAPERPSERRATSPALLQLLFQFVSQPDSVNWSVRQLEPAAGISKSRVAQARSQLVEEGLLVRAGNKYRLGPVSLVSERLVSGYGQILRPKLAIGNFRPAERTSESFLVRLRSELPGTVRYSLTGGPAADLLQHLYSGQETPLFVKPSTRPVAQQLRLLPDREGPVTLLSAFGDVVFWQTRANHMLAPPWLIYAELLTSDDPRAHEAAEELRREFLA